MPAQEKPTATRVARYRWCLNLGVRGFILSCLLALPCWATTLPGDGVLTAETPSSLNTSLLAAETSPMAISSDPVVAGGITSENIAKSVSNQTRGQSDAPWVNPAGVVDDPSLFTSAFSVIEPTTLGLLIGGLGLLMLRVWRAKL